MILKEKEFRSRTGNIYILRSPEEKDAKTMLELFKKQTEETDNGLSYPEEVLLTVEQEASFIKMIANSERNFFYAAYDGEHQIGNAMIECVNERKKTRHRANFAISILKDYWGQGLGRKLLQEVIEAAKEAGYEQVELEVVETNERAIKLYESEGFEHVGKYPRGFKLKDGTYADMLVMCMDLSL